MSMPSIFILVSFFLGIMVGSVITYAIMGKYFSDALDTVAKASHEATHELTVAKDRALKTNQKSLVLVLVTILAFAAAIAVTYFVAKSGYRASSQAQETIGENLENLDNTKALKGISDGVKRAN